MKISFTRITSSGNFIPEIDGLRFIAILFVVIFHLNIFISAKDSNHYIDTIDYSFLNKIWSSGHIGVPLFFIISGFILGMPFAKFYILNEKKVSLKNYFLRRLTRLEPPYFIVLSVLLLGILFVTKTLQTDEALESYFASFFYCSNFIYPGELPKINGVTWSLEIEIQFYILAPLLAYLFSVKLASIRRKLIVFLIVALGVLNQYLFHAIPFLSILNFLHYFLIGFLLVDLYITNSTVFPKTKFDSVIGLFLIVILIFQNEMNLEPLFLNIIELGSMFLLLYYILFHKTFPFLSSKVITNIGGMCYTIYLIHYPIFSLFGNPLFEYSFSNYSFINITIYVLVLFFLVLLLSSLFFLLIEKPCMKKDWPKKVFIFFKPI